MSSTDQKEYLKKYLGNGKKKKKVKVLKGKGTRIVDDDVAVPAGADDADQGLLDAPDEQPQVAAVTSDAPPAAADKRWKTLDECDLEELESQREILSESLKMLEQEDVPRQKLLQGDEPARDGEESPPASGGGRAAGRRRHDSEASSGSESSSDSDSGLRRRDRRRHDSDESPPRKRPAGRADSDESPPRQRPGAGGGRRDSDESPPRRRPAGRAATDGVSPTKRSRPRPRADSDESPPRKKVGDGRRRANSDESPPRRRGRDERPSDGRRRAEPDAGPSRRKPAADDRLLRPVADASSRRGRADSPARRRGDERRGDERRGGGDERRGGGDERRPARSRRDSDESPPRRSRAGRDGSADSASPPRSWRRPQNSSRAGSPPAAPPSHTLDGKKAGLQDINALREENRAARRREQKTLAEMDETVSGKNAETKVRGRKLQENKERAAKKAEEEEKAKERKKKYDAWGKGLKQAEERRARAEDNVREANKPLARYADDKDLESELRRRQRQDDPMAEYIQRKKTKADGPTKDRPKYNKSQPPANRYNIWPGYRWDGVDRSNGFEKELFLRRNAKKARDTDAYKWSTEDM